MYTKVSIKWSTKVYWIFTQSPPGLTYLWWKWQMSNIHAECQIHCKSYSIEYKWYNNIFEYYCLHGVYRNSHSTRVSLQTYPFEKNRVFLAILFFVVSLTRSPCFILNILWTNFIDFQWLYNVCNTNTFSSYICFQYRIWQQSHKTMDRKWMFEKSIQYTLYNIHHCVAVCRNNYY